MLLENTAGTQGPLGRDFDELAGLVELLDGDERVGICLDSCHLLASGFEIRTVEALDDVVDEFDAKVGLDRLRCLHLNDSKIPLGGNRDRHANLGQGEIGERGLARLPLRPALRRAADADRDRRHATAHPGRDGRRARADAAQARTSPPAGRRSGDEGLGRPSAR